MRKSGHTYSCCIKSKAAFSKNGTMQATCLEHRQTSELNTYVASLIGGDLASTGGLSNTMRIELLFAR